MPWEKQFDKGQALNRAMEAFWAGGYEGTSLVTLLERMGIQKGSFYDTFGSKHEVLLEALEEYLRERFRAFGALAGEPSVVEALRRHLREVAEEACGAGGERGCFVVNAALELALRDEEVRGLVQRAFGAHILGYRSLLETAVKRGEFPADRDPGQTASALFALVVGVRVLARACMPREVILAVRDQALALLN